MPITTEGKLYRFIVDPKNVDKVVRQMPTNVAMAHVYLGVPPYHLGNDPGQISAYVDECARKGVLPFMKFRLMPDLSRNILLPEPDPIKFRSLHDRCPINRDLQTRINHALMKGGKVNEAQFTIDKEWSDQQRPHCFKMFQDALKCWFDAGYELTSFKSGYAGKSLPEASSMARTDSYGAEVLFDGSLWMLHIKSREQHSQVSKALENLFHQYGKPATNLVKVD